MSSAGQGWNLWTDLAPRAGTLNMAIDQALLGRAAQRAERWLRLYTWRPHCLSFGRHEPAARRYDAGRIAEAGLDVVRRPTGGRAVLHARELTYAVAAPASVLGDLRAAYLEIHRMLLGALRRLGADATLAENCPAPGLASGACFARPVGGEILLEGRKVVGSAQLREGDALLQHGSILLEDDQSLLTDLSRDRAHAGRSAPLSLMVGRRIGPVEAAEAVSAAAEARWRSPWTCRSECADVLEESAGHLPRYQSPEWTWRA
jgi:lipoyl(octanoyl) transferase